MSKITILGAGPLGSAFSVLLTDRKHGVDLVGTHLDGEIIERLRIDLTHPVLGLQLAPTVNPTTYEELGTALDRSDLLVVAVNSLGIDWVSMMLNMIWTSGSSADIPILLLTKGLEGKNDGNHYVSKNERLRILPETLREGLMPVSENRFQVMTLSGIPHARELCTRNHTSAVLAGTDQAQLEKVASLLRTTYFHVSTSTDLIGVEVSAALQHLYALAVGVNDGLQETYRNDEKSRSDHGFMLNSAAAIFSQALVETSYLVEYMGGEQQSILGVAGAGTLYALAQDSPNSNMGRLLGLGMRYTDAKQQHMPHDAVEGAEVALAIGRTVEFLVRQGDLDPSRIPLLRMLTDVICNDGVADIPWDQFHVTQNQTS